MYVGNDKLVHSIDSSTFVLDSPTKKIAFCFTAPKTTTLNHFYFRQGTKSGLPNSPNCTLELDVSGAPSGVPLATVNPTIGASGTWVDCVFNYQIISEQVYWVVVSGVTGYSSTVKIIIYTEYIDQIYSTNELVTHFSYGPPYRDHNCKKTRIYSGSWTGTPQSHLGCYQLNFNSFSNIGYTHSAIYRPLGGASEANLNFRVGGNECIKYKFFINTAFYADKIYLGAICDYRSIGAIIRRPTENLIYKLYNKNNSLVASAVFVNSSNAYYNTGNKSIWSSTSINYSFSTGNYTLVLTGTPTPNTSGFHYHFNIFMNFASQKNYLSFQGATPVYSYSADSGKSWTDKANNYELPFKFSVRAITGTVKSFDNNFYTGCKVIVNQHTTHSWAKCDITDASGYYQIPLTRAWHNGMKIVKYDYDYSTIPFAVNAYSSANFNSNYNTVKSITATSSAASYWWSTQDNGKPTSPGMNYAYREKISFGNSHGRYSTSNVITITTKTGNLKSCPAKFVFYNAAIQSWEFCIDHANDKTHIVYLSSDWKVRGITYDHINDVWLSTSKLIASLSPIGDTHYAPAMCVDHSGYIHILYNAHDSEGAIKYIKSLNPNSLESWNTPYSITSKAPAASYPRPYVDSNNNLYVFHRWRSGDNSMWAVTKKDSGDDTINGWHSALYICKFMGTDSAPAGKEKKAIYSVGNAIDSDGNLHVAPVFTNGYSQGTHDLGIGYFYSTSDGYRWNDLKKNQPWSAYYDGGPPLSGIPNPYSYSTVSLVIRGTCDPTVGTRQYGGNFDSMAIHPIDISTPGLKRAFFLFNSYVTADPIDQGFHFQIAKFDISSKNWITHTVDPNNQRFFSGEYVGYGLVFGDGNRLYTNYCYGESSAKPWGGGPMMLAIHSIDNGSSWSSRVITGHNGHGLIRPCLKRNYNSKFLESVIQIGDKLYYAKDYLEPFYMRSDGDDYRIVYQGTEIDRVADTWNSEQTKIEFKLQSELATNYPYSLLGNYYIYYGKT